MRRFRNAGNWLWDARAAWAALFAPPLALLLVWQLPREGEFLVRVAGYVVTLFGVALVAKGVSETQEQFGRPTIQRRAFAWMGRFSAIFKRHSVIATVGAGTIRATGYAAGIVVSARPNNSISERLRQVEAALKRLDERTTASEAALRHEIAEARDLVVAERAERAAGDKALSETLERYSTGSLDWELVGAAWVVVGQGFGSFPVEIAHLLSKLPLILSLR